MNNSIKIANRLIGAGHPCYIIAELSANHNNSFEHAEAIVRAAKDCGADAVKLQTYTPDTITIKSDNDCFKIGAGTVWEGKTLYDLYEEAYMPWEWQPKLKDIADRIGIDLFSTPFDNTSVDFLQKMDVSAYKIASFELVDIPLIRYVARQGKPVIMSTGMATETEIAEAVAAVYAEGNRQLALLKCTSAYPAQPEEMNLRAMDYLADRFDVAVGLSDHSMDPWVSVVAVALGACIIEKHFTLSRSSVGPDSEFSLEPAEFSAMVNAVRSTETSLGSGLLEITDSERSSLVFRRSLFVVKDIQKNEAFTHENIRSIRPGHGLPPGDIYKVIGRHAKCDISRGTPLSWDLVL